MTEIYDGVDAPSTASMCQSGGVEHHLREASVSEVITIGLDIAKHVFHVHGADERGRAIFSKRISRRKLLDFFAVHSSCTGGSCPVTWCGSGAVAVTTGGAGSIKLSPRRAT